MASSTKMAPATSTVFPSFSPLTPNHSRSFGTLTTLSISACDQHADPERAERVEGSLFESNQHADPEPAEGFLYKFFRMYTYEKFSCNPFRMHTYGAKDLKPTGMNTYVKHPGGVPIPTVFSHALRC